MAQRQSLVNRKHRREFLKWTGASSLALAPFMQHARAEVQGDVQSLPKRFVFVVKSNGLRPYGVVPSGLEAMGQSGFKSEKLVDESLVDKTLAASMNSLTPFKNQTTIIQGLSSRICKGPHGGHYGVLGAYTSADHAPPRRETLDVTLSKTFPGIFPHLAFHIGSKADEQIKYLDISAKGKNSRTPAYASPELAYKDIFGAVLAGGEAKLEVQANQNLMDFLIDDVKQAKRSLGSREKEKLDHYLQGFEALKDRQAKLTDRKGSLAKHAPPMDNKFTSEIETHRLEAHFDLAAAALITGLTNAITIRADDLDVRYQGFQHARMKEISVHEIGHTADVEGTTDRYDSNWKQGREMRKNIRTFQSELIAGLATKLRNIPEGDGTMLDNTLIVYFSDAGSQHHTSYDNMPTVVVGNMRGKLNTGRYLHYPAYNQPGHRTFASLLTSVLHAAELPSESYGDKDQGLNPDIDQNGPLAEWIV